jgi:hypothetical protein
MRIFTLTTLLPLALILSACSAIPLNTGAEKVRLTNREPDKTCKFLGDVQGGQGGYWTGGYTSNENLETGARNDLKNKAAALGGNTVAILSDRATDAGYFLSSYKQDVMLVGNVYACP